MRIRYMSDLHLEFTDYQPRTIPSVGEDVVVLAGDIGVGLNGVKWACSAFGDRPVIYVMGNHEFYGNHFVELPREAKALTEGTNVHVLEDEMIVINGVRFMGCTLWTDFKLFGPERSSLCMQVAMDMADYRLIQHSPSGILQTIYPGDTKARHRSSRIWLDRQIGQSTEPCVVVTHHGPSFLTCEMQHKHDFLSAAFLSNAEDLLHFPVRAWIFGHTHQAMKFEISGIPLLTNQRGYPGQDVPRFSWDTCFDLNIAIADFPM